MRLDNEKDTFHQLIVNTARYFHILDEYVEKDYWLVLLLKEIMSKDLGYVFKGGTSLSKCYHLVNRFSEDIDISYSDPYSSLTINDIDRRFKGITKSIKEVGFEIENKEHLRRNRYFNQFKCPYKTLVAGNRIENKIIIELAAQTPSFPACKKEIQSFIAEYLKTINRDDLIKIYELESFEINVQSLSRTVVDKTFALCDYYLSNKCNKHSRHIYDLYKILSCVELDDDLAMLYLEVRKYRQKLSICESAKDGVFLHEIIEKIIKEETYKNDYEKLTMPLLYESVSYVNCEKTLSKLQLFLKNHNL